MSKIESGGAALCDAVKSGVGLPDIMVACCDAFRTRR